MPKSRQAIRRIAVGGYFAAGSMVLALGGVLWAQNQRVNPELSSANVTYVPTAQEIRTFDPFSITPGSKPTQNVTNVTVVQQPISNAIPEDTFHGTASVAQMGSASIGAGATDFIPQSVSSPSIANANPIKAFATNAVGAATSTDHATISANSADITVGTATINVLSSFKLNYGGKTVVTGQDGSVSVK